MIYNGAFPKEYLHYIVRMYVQNKQNMIDITRHKDQLEPKAKWIRNVTKVNQIGITWQVEPLCDSALHVYEIVY